MWTVSLPLPDDTRALAAALADVALEHTVVALVGPLGAGKTCFAQGLGAGLGVAEPILSPTFVLMTEYAGRLPLLHADAYRLRRSDLAGIGLEEALETWDGVALLEWADRFPEVLPGDHLVVALSEQGAGRVASVEATGPRSAALLAAWRGRWQGR